MQGLDKAQRQYDRMEEDILSEMMDEDQAREAEELQAEALRRMRD